MKKWSVFFKPIELNWLFVSTVIASLLENVPLNTLLRLWKWSVKRCYWRCFYLRGSHGRSRGRVTSPSKLPVSRVQEQIQKLKFTPFGSRGWKIFKRRFSVKKKSIKCHSSGDRIRIQPLRNLHAKFFTFQRRFT